jgi:membrane protease YdiL (CAAX protease family)
MNTTYDNPAVDGSDEKSDLFSLTRMIYAVSGGTLLYLLLEYSGWFFFQRKQVWFFDFSRADLWFHVANLFFVTAMLCVGIGYGFSKELFRWEPRSEASGWVRSISFGLLGGAIALVLASPIFWFGLGRTRLESIQMLIGSALSPLAVFDLLFFIFALAVSSEIVFRGIVLRTIARYAGVPAAALASCLPFAYIFPVLGFAPAIILGVTSSILYDKTRTLLAPILANALFTVGGSGIALYHNLMYSG